eukprot:39345_1
MEGPYVDPLSIPTMTVDSEEPLVEKRETSRLLGAGLMSGVAVATLFNPWDRALYLSVRNNVAFLSRSNFRAPFQGVWPTVVTRALSSGMYFPLVDCFQPIIRRSAFFEGRELMTSFTAGTCAGVVSGCILNMFSAVKYHSWGRDDLTFLGTGRHMWKTGGFRPFRNGMGATVSRDMVFGSVFAVTRLLIRERTDNGSEVAAYEFTAAVGATMISSPLNFCRNAQYWTQPHEIQRSIPYLLQRLVHKTIESDRPFNHLQARLRLGWGTLRVGAGMATTSYLYEYLKSGGVSDVD